MSKDYPVVCIPAKMDLFPSPFISLRLPCRSVQRIPIIWKGSMKLSCIITLLKLLVFHLLRIVRMFIGATGTSPYCVVVCTSSCIQGDNDPFFGGFGSLTTFTLGQVPWGSGVVTTMWTTISRVRAVDFFFIKKKKKKLSYSPLDISELSSSEWLPRIYGNTPPAPPPPLPPSGGVHSDDGDGDSFTSFIWKSFKCGTLCGLFVKLYLYLKNRKLEALAVDLELKATLNLCWALVN